MSDIFISYAHEDQPFVLRMSERLQAEGFSVKWDHAIPPGKSWDQVIAAGIENAKACIVVWSKQSVASEWVKEEATLAREARKYLPVSVDDSIPPMGFRLIQAAHLDAWAGDPNNAQWRMLVTEAKSMLAARSSVDSPLASGAPAYQAPPVHVQSAQAKQAQSPPQPIARPAYQPPPVRRATTGAAPAATSAPHAAAQGGFSKPLLTALISGAVVFSLLLLGSLSWRQLNKPGAELAINAPPTLPAPTGAPTAPATSAPVAGGGLSAESVMAAAGQWLGGAPTAPVNPTGFYMIANDGYGHGGYVGMGSIVSIHSCDSVNCRVDINYGHGSNACEGWYVIPTDMTYLGASYDPNWQAISDQLFPRDTHQAELTTRCPPT